MDNEIAVISLSDYLYETREPEVSWPDHWFEEICFSRWAAEELIHAILDHPMVCADETVEKFAIKMTAYSALSDGTDAGRIFSIAAKFAYKTLEMFREEYTNA